jgi:hypothetical protein
MGFSGGDWASCRLRFWTPCGLPGTIDGCRKVFLSVRERNFAWKVENGNADYY